MFSKIHLKSLIYMMAGVLVMGASATAKTYYVATNGNDSANGSSTSPFRTIKNAVKVGLKPGDEVRVRTGTYNEKVYVHASGSSGAYITIRSDVPGGAKINASGFNAGIFVMDSSYVKIDGFEVYGASQSGISSDHVHHVTVSNNESHDNGGAGVYFGKSDFILVEANVLHGNAFKAVTSGISIHLPFNILNDNTFKGFRIILRNNVSYNNLASGRTDGNGIIFDEFRAARKSYQVPYTFPTLIENNLTYGNAGVGIMVFQADNVTVRNNTSWGNSLNLKSTSTWRAEIQNTNGSKNTYVNNIAVADPKQNKYNKAYANVAMYGDINQSVTYKNNLSFNGTVGSESTMASPGFSKPTSANGNKLGVDPKFSSTSKLNFHLLSGSPAINSGTSANGVPPQDLDGKQRVVKTIDMGAYEFQ